MERRAFLKSASAGVAALTVLPSVPPAKAEAVPESQEGEDNYQPPDWLRYARTIYFDGKTPPIYPHLDDFDAQRLVNIVIELGGDTLRFEPVSFWAYYPTKAYPMHPELGSRDLIDEVARECRNRGIHHYCYTKYGNPFMEKGWEDRHPEYADWVLRGPDGRPYGTYDGMGWVTMQKPCTTGDAYRQAIRQVVRELCEHDIDGVYLDAPSEFGYTDICFCASCRRNFQAFSGINMDRLQNPQDMEARISWFRWWNHLTEGDLLEFRKIIHGSGKFMLCHNGATWEGTSLRAQYRIPDGFMVEHSTQIYSRLMRGLMGASMARPSRKLAQMYLGSYCVADFDQPPHSHPWAVHDANLEDGDEILMEGFTNLACGNTPIYATLNRLFYGIGSGSAKPAREVYDVMRQVESLLKDSVPVPYVTVVPTWEALQLWRTRRQSWNMEMSQGFSLAMLDERMNLDACPSTEVTESWLQSQRVIALCGASGISSEQAKMFADWVQGGGALLATYDTGLYDENGQLRLGGALKEVLGVDMKGEPVDSQAESYYRINESHPALGEYHIGAVVMGDGRLVPVEPTNDAKVLADCWNLGTKQSRGPAIVANTYGKGRSVYISGSLEAYYTASRVVSLRRLLASAVRYLAGNAPVPFTASAPRGVYGELRRAPNGDLILWLLANIGFKDADIGRMRQEFTPVSNVEVRVLVPDGRTVKSVRLVRAAGSMPFRVEGGYAVATLPTLHVAEMVHLELG